ncbi:hypothetical protein QA596_10700 [Balneolales bacterium ANBcel1]|nr:hypothetical protein [Balneolales bacterium ANBcel1]
MLRKSYILLVSSILAFTVWSCDDDSPTGPDLSDAPESPSMDHVEMDLSVFENAENYGAFKAMDPESFLKELPTLADHHELSAYEQAAFFAAAAEMYFQIMGQFPNIFFAHQDWGDPSLDGNTWVWEWSFAAEGESMTMTVTAESVDDERHWELRYTTQGMDGQDDLDNELLIASQVRLDGSGGSWQLYDFFEDDPVFLVDYALEDEITTMVDMHFFEEEDGRFYYERDGSQSILELWDVVYGGNTTIEWNNETHTGSIQSPEYHGGDRVCWDENYTRTEC